VPKPQARVAAGRTVAVYDPDARSRSRTRGGRVARGRTARSTGIALALRGAVRAAPPAAGPTAVEVVAVSSAAALTCGLVVLARRARTRLSREAAPPAPAAGALGARVFLRPYRGPLTLAAALIVLGTLLDLAAPWPLKIAVDHVIGDRPLPAWLAPLGSLGVTAQAVAVALAGVGLVAASGVVGYLTAILVGGASERIGADLRVAVFAAFQRRSLAFHDRHRTGDLVSRLTADVGRVQDEYVAWFETVVPDGLAVLGMIAVLAALDPQMALAALAVVPLLALQTVRSRSRMKRAEGDVRERHGRLASRATEVLRNVRAVQAFLRQDDEERRYRRDSAEVTRSALAALDVGARYGPLADVILAGGAGLILVLGIRQVAAGTMTVGTLFVVLAYVSSLYGPIRSLTRLTSVFARGAASRERLREVFDDDDRVAEAPDAVPAADGPAEIALHAVTFGYEPTIPVLRDLHLEVHPAETVCVVGATGAGKSTLLALLLRLYDPDAGTIAVGGVDVRRLTLRSLRGRLALVPQDPWILDGTIAENVRYACPDATDEAVRLAGTTALVDEFVARLPDGYDTQVGEGGARLSGGQRRRIALARALVRDAAVLLLDEPTSGLDARSEALVIDALRRAARRRTVVMVTHRLRLAAIADRVLVLDGGRLVEQGPPARLLAAGGRFAELWAHQTLPRLESRTRSAIRMPDDARE
jgi:ATP-binding cassette, subfamily B, bacterial